MSPIDPDKLPAAAVEAATGDLGAGYEAKIGEGAIAAFLDALLADDKAMHRGLRAIYASDVIASDYPKFRAALTAAVQEDR